ncbi:bifunctional DNA-formamidopyrimidine glycosylase/DNA-(apurinic or apyrimidinic site) lyase [Roseibacterium sp. SDUM158017]|uniref:bifunctional DNA-formamidopyrimidine glycosylase/DNA-(apurinic or apyrimidinic site) lyase n=1 Tax=Roseicyclus salinarum TaxID=3036773 RepID=UPI0024156712|nr:bifunctional DNA-formamidopyrimidine glycosylase/DNA-(apurinic or apyrimidinic site) lyase [Roseibacterium sp. SDUM158017]MDG4649251.1 bifunctional DNA-formamidopyrimidine glycosylase/DNA-(apurinic or apyrimidinic site) lyase [Roseibacterium sp. SDUM158017]
MPELPEVETVRRGLAPVLEGAVIVRAQVNRPDLRWPFPDRMAERLTGVRVERLGRRSKYILADLSSGETLIVHLGMSGRMIVSGGMADRAAPGVFHHHHPAPEKHDHVVLDTDAGMRVTFNDSRRFGAIDLIATERAAEHWLLAGLGPEPLGNAFNDAGLAERFEGRRTPVKAALLDQRIVAGLGNIYVCEALHRSGISPLRHAGRIARPRVARLVGDIRDVLSEAIEAGGSSLRDYRQTDGDLGYFQHSFRVYGREDEPCLKPACPGVIRRKVQSGRSSFYCPVCQR